MARRTQAPNPFLKNFEAMFQTFPFLRPSGEYDQLGSIPDIYYYEVQDLGRPATLKIGPSAVAIQYKNSVLGFYRTGSGYAASITLENSTAGKIIFDRAGTVVAGSFENGYRLTESNLSELFEMCSILFELRNMQEIRNFPVKKTPPFFERADTKKAILVCPIDKEGRVEILDKDLIEKGMVYDLIHQRNNGIYVSF